MSIDFGHLANVPAQRARDDSDACAVSLGEESLTYGELASRSERLARQLVSDGLQSGERIAFLDKNSLRFFEIFFGALQAGGVVVGVNFRLAAPEVEYIVNDAKVNFLFVGREFYSLVESIEASLPAARTIIAIDGDHDRWPSLDAWVRGKSTDALPVPDPDSDVLQLYTSGTTGRPKGAYVSNRAWHAFAESACSGWARLGPDDTQLICMPLCHIAGINSALIGFLQGAANVVTRDVIPAEILDIIEKERITTTLLAPAIIQSLLVAAEGKAADYSSIRTLSYGAAPIAPSVLDAARELFQCDFVHLYGLTECLGAATWLAAEDHDPARGKLRSCGLPYQGAEIRIVDENRVCLGADEVGEIEVRAPWLMRGYWNLPEATGAALKDGWLSTGDAGYLDDEGYLYIHDRVKDMIVTGGENVYPAEVENAVFGHPAVADVAVIGVPDDRWGEAVKAIVVCKAGANVSADEIVAWARERIAGFKLPKSVDFVDVLPRNASGKVLRRELREPFWAGRERRVN